MSISSATLGRRKDDDRHGRKDEETRTGFKLQRCNLDPPGDNGKDDVCLQFMSDQDYSLRAKSQIRKELLSGQAAKIGLSGWAAKTTLNNLAAYTMLRVASVYHFRSRV